MITIRCDKYDNRKVIATKRVKVDGKWTVKEELDENGNVVLKQVDNDLPGTVKDVEDFKHLLTNFNMAAKDLTEFTLFEPTPDEVHATIN